MRLVKLSELREYELVYVATPYTNFPAGLDEAFAEAAKICAKLIKKGIQVYSPIVNAHPISVYGRVDPKDHGFWLPYDMAMMRKSDALVIAKLESWELSHGIALERKQFVSAKKPYYYIDPVTLEVTQNDDRKG
jgi:hypothetical protein